MRTTVDFREVTDAMHEFQEAHRAASVEVPLFYLIEVSVLPSGIGNLFAPNPASTVLWNVEDWFVER